MQVAVRNDIRFLLNDQTIVLGDVAADRTLLDFLRLERRLTGTKEGCAEGDCGACTVLVGRLTQGELIYEPVNACIRFLATIDRCHVVTVEHLSGEADALHPVQQALVDFHGSQCGFCTPGFVMALYALWLSKPNPTETQIEQALQGNLCRCTGYEPIIKAAKAAGQYGQSHTDKLVTQHAATTRQLRKLAEPSRVETGPPGNRSILPIDVDDLAAVLIEQDNPTIVAGATDVGLWVTKFLNPIAPAVFIDHLDELKTISQTDAHLQFGACVSYSQSLATLAEHYPQLVNYWNRIAGWQVRNMGTLGGNIANGSPIGDTPPVFIALDATLVLRKGDERREISLESFFIDYGQQDLQAGEFVERIHVPRPQAGQICAAYKISKRRDEDISSVAMGINMLVQDGVIERCRIALGGMAATPKRALKTETALTGKSWHIDSFIEAAAHLQEDFKPISDWRASASYRMQTAQNLLQRFFLENDELTAEPVKLASA